MGCSSYAAFLVEINTPTWQQDHFNEDDNQIELRSFTKLIEEFREMDNI